MTSPESGAGTAFYVVDLAHHRSDARYITFWRPDDRGYAYPLAWAGLYERDRVSAHVDYYNDGVHAVAVQASCVAELQVAPKPGTIDGDAGPVVLNTKENWQAILASLSEKPASEPRPMWPGRRQRRCSESYRFERGG